MEIICKTYVNKIYCGSYNEIVKEEVSSRDPSKIKNDGLMIGFYFYDKEFILDGRKIIDQKELNRSKFIYCGERFSLEEIKHNCVNNPKYGSLYNLISRMEAYGNKYACFTNGGCFLIMRAGEMTYDEILDKKKKLVKAKKNN